MRKRSDEDCLLDWLLLAASAVLVTFAIGVSWWILS